MDNKEQIINGIMKASSKFVSDILDSIYRSAMDLSVENEYGRKMVNMDLLKNLMDSAKENVKKAANG